MSAVDDVAAWNAVLELGRKNQLFQLGLQEKSAPYTLLHNLFRTGQCFVVGISGVVQKEVEIFHTA